MAIRFGARLGPLKMWFSVTPDVFQICEHKAVLEGRAIPFFSKRVMVHVENDNQFTVEPLEITEPILLQYDPDETDE